MTGLNGQRVYLDWNASAPLRPEARVAMLAAMDVVGNPSSVHAEGRAARAIVENARGQVAALVECEPDEVVFTSGATEAAATVARQFWTLAVHTGMEHDCILVGFAPSLNSAVAERLVTEGDPSNDALPGGEFWSDDAWQDLGETARGRSAPVRVVAGATAGCGETGIMVAASGVINRMVAHVQAVVPGAATYTFSDVTQAIGRVRRARQTRALDFAILSAHKFGGPSGVGALTSDRAEDLHPVLTGGGQERYRRSGTENVVGIAGFGAAAEAAWRDLDAGVWDRVERLRDDLEDRLATAAPDVIIFGKNASRLPNTSCFAIPGWAGETQVMQMDLAGFAVSAGSACSSGKVKKASRVLTAMGFDEVTASSAIRVSMGATTTEAEVMAFADAWIDAYRRRKDRAA